MARLFDEFTLNMALEQAASDLNGDHSVLIGWAETRAHAIAATLSSHMRDIKIYLGGSIPRQTWGSPHYSTDAFFVLERGMRRFLDVAPSVISAQITAALQYVHPGTRQKDSGRIALNDGFWQGNGPEHPSKVFVLPAFEAERGLMIPDRWRDQWICVDLNGFDPLMESADRQLPNWRELTRILKAWNNRDGRFDPFIKPGLLIDTMVMTIGEDAWGPDLATQLVAMFQLMYRRFEEDWPDPAGLAPNLSSYMTRSRRTFAMQHLKHSWLTLAQAKRADSGGELREAKRLARSVLGKMISIEPRDTHGILLVREPFQKHD